MKKTIVQIEHLSAELLIKQLSLIETRVEELHEKINPPLSTQLMTRQEVADHFKVSLVTVHDWLNKKWLKSYRIGNKVRFKRHEVVDAVKEIHRKRKGAGND